MCFQVGKRNHDPEAVRARPADTRSRAKYLQRERVRAPAVNAAQDFESEASGVGKLACAFKNKP